MRKNEKSVSVLIKSTLLNRIQTDIKHKIEQLREEGINYHNYSSFGKRSINHTKEL